MREELDPLLRLSLLLQTMGFYGQRSPPRLWIRQANRCLSQSLEVLFSTTLLRPARAVDLTLVFSGENCTARCFNFLYAATFRHRLALT